MENLAGIFICGIFVYGICRIFELYVRRKERMAIIEKLGEQIKLSEATNDLDFPLFQKSKIMPNSNWALKVSLLLTGIGIGLLVGYGFEFAATGGDLADYSRHWDFQRKIEVVYGAGVCVFGGIGLLAAYFIERKHK